MRGWPLQPSLLPPTPRGISTNLSLGNLVRVDVCGRGGGLRAHITLLSRGVCFGIASLPRGRRRKHAAVVVHCDCRLHVPALALVLHHSLPALGQARSVQQAARSAGVHHVKQVAVHEQRGHGLIVQHGVRAVRRTELVTQSLLIWLGNEICDGIQLVAGGVQRAQRVLQPTSVSGEQGGSTQAAPYRP